MSSIKIAITSKTSGNMDELVIEHFDGGSMEIDSNVMTLEYTTTKYIQYNDDDSDSDETNSISDTGSDYEVIDLSLDTDDDTIDYDEYYIDSP